MRPVAAVLQTVLKFAQIPVGLRHEPFDALAVHPGCPVVAGDFPPPRLEGRRSDGLVHQTVPLASFDAVAQRRHHALGPDRCFRPPPRFAAVGFCPLLSPFGHSRGGLLRHSRPRTSNFLPSFPRGGFATRPSPRPRPYRGNMKAVTPVDLTNRQVSPLTPLCRPGIPASTTQAARRSLCQSFQRRRLFPGFATERQARHSVTPNQVRHPPDCQFTSSCSPPRLTATQLLSITEPTTGSGTDLHRADKASSRTHLSRRKAGTHSSTTRNFLKHSQCLASGDGFVPRNDGPRPFAGEADKRIN